jgi:hypothetical protein
LPKRRPPLREPDPHRVRSGRWQAARELSARVLRDHGRMTGGGSVIRSRAGLSGACRAGLASTPPARPGGDARTSSPAPRSSARTKRGLGRASARQSAVRGDPPERLESSRARPCFPSGRCGLSRSLAPSAPTGSARRGDLPPEKERLRRSAARPSTEADRVSRPPGARMASASAERSAVSTRVSADPADRRDSTPPAEGYRARA